MAEDLRADGNKLFTKGHWTKAITKYGQYLNILLKEKGDEAIRSKIVIGYSNRAEAWLKLEKNVKALEDCEKALELDKSHVKTLMRKCRALEGLRIYQEAVEAYEVLHQHSQYSSLTKDEKDWIESASRVARIKDRQTRLGEIEDDFVESWEQLESGPELLDCCPALEEYVGPLEIKRVPGMGRGLVATRKIAAGELLLVSNAVTSNVLSIDYGEIQPIEKTIELLVPALEDVVRDSIDHSKSLSCLQRLVQIDTLGGPYPNESPFRDCPPMRYFTPVNALPPGCRKVTAQDSQHPALSNHFDKNFLRTVIQNTQLYNYGSKLIRVQEIYVLPSLMNHSCRPNVSIVGLRNEMCSRVFRATRDIQRGEELTHAYHNIFCPVDERRWLFGGVKCECARCKMEEKLLSDHPLLNYIAGECTDLGVDVEPLTLSGYPLETLERVHRRCISGISAVNSIFRDIPKLAELDDEDKDLIQSSFIRFYRLLLDPSMQKLPGYSFSVVPRMTATAIMMMSSCDPASELGLAMCSEATRKMPMVYNPNTDSMVQERYNEVDVLLTSARRMIELTYGPELTCKTIFKILVSFQDQLPYLQF